MKTLDLDTADRLLLATLAQHAATRMLPHLERLIACAGNAGHNPDHIRTVRVVAADIAHLGAIAIELRPWERSTTQAQARALVDSILIRHIEP